MAIALAGAPWVPARGQPAAAPSTPAPPVRTLGINEFRVEGVEQLSGLEVESVLVPFLGAGRTLEDVEKARAALEKAYFDLGYQTVVVAIPPQTVRGGVVTLKVTEGKVGRLRVNGTKWFSPFEIKRLAPSVQEGKVPNFNDLVKDIVVLNQWPDRRVTPALRAGSEPGTVDVDLNVQETFPLHGSIEGNNRFSVNTVHFRLNGALRYDNLWQLGHSLGFSFQVAPKRTKDALVFAGNYLARFPGAPWFTLAFNGVVQDSDVSTLGGTAVRGRGRIFGARAVANLPGSTEFFHALSAGLDYKLFLEDIAAGENKQSNPVHYWPVTTQYGGTLLTRSSQTAFSVSAVFNIRGLSSSDVDFDNKRYKASASFVYYRGDVGHTQGLPGDLQLFFKVSGQYGPDPLVGPEQFTAGGADSVRGYLEVEASGDLGALGSFELRSPSLGRWLGPTVKEWRFYAFTEGGRVWIHDPLPEQKSFATLWGVGGGTRFRFWDHLSGTFDVGVPLTVAGPTPKYQPRIHFRVAGEF
jgi:hemolysin activation/secretion protein